MNKSPPRFSMHIIATSQAADDAQTLLVQHHVGSLNLTKDQRSACSLIRNSYLYGIPLFAGDIECLNGVGAFTQDQWGK